MHNVDIDLVDMAMDVMKFAINRITDADPPLGFPKRDSELRELVGFELDSWLVRIRVDTRDCDSLEGLASRGVRSIRVRAGCEQRFEPSTQSSWLFSGHVGDVVEWRRTQSCQPRDFS